VAFLLRRHAVVDGEPRDAHEERAHELGSRRVAIVRDDRPAARRRALEAHGAVAAEHLDGTTPKEEKIPAGQELAAGPLNDLRNALGDLKIIDVARKPAGLSAELKAEEKFTGDPEAVTSMQQRGFLPLKTGEILSTDGETIVGMKDGVEYVLRFGAGTTVAGDEKKDGCCSMKKASCCPAMQDGATCPVTGKTTNG
jgi:hypothetical protein